MRKRNRIVAYIGAGNAEQVLIRGHYFKYFPVRDVELHHNVFDNIRQAVNRFRIKPHVDQKLKVSVGSENVEVSTNSQGYFEVMVNHPEGKDGWFNYKVHDPMRDISEQGDYFVPASGFSALISDIDDTLLVSHSTRFYKKIRLLLFRNAHSRKKTIASSIHKKLGLELPGSEIDSFFYVSNSEWNLYDFLSDFFNIHQLPKGPYFLNNLKTNPMHLVRTGNAVHSHKRTSISFLMDFYKDKQFFLLGDSGQKDMSVYLDITEKYTGQVKGVFIRKLHRRSRTKIINEFREKFKKLRVPFYAFTDKELEELNFGN